MSFYWQQALPQQGTGQNSSNQREQQGQWDYINLGGAPNQHYQWSSPQQQQQQRNQQNSNQTNYSNYQHTVNQDNSSNQQYPNQHVAQNQQQQHQQQQQQPQFYHQPIIQSIQQQQPSNLEQKTLEPTSVPTNQQGQNFQNSSGQTQQQLRVQPVQPVQQNQEYQQWQAHQQQQQQQQQNQYNSYNQSIENAIQQSQGGQQYYPTASVQPIQQYETGNVPQQTEAHVTTSQIPAVAQAAYIPSSHETTPEIQSVQRSGSLPAESPAARPAAIQPQQAPAVVTNQTRSQAQAEQLVVEALNTRSSTTGAEGLKVTPSSSEDDWEKADMEVQSLEEESKKSKSQTGPKTPQEIERQGESRESSVGGSWSINDSEAQVTDDKNEHNLDGSQESQNNWVIDTTTIEKTPEADVSRLVTPDTKNEENTFNLSASPGEAQATSTPKDPKLEKRGSTSSQKTIEAEVKPNHIKNENLLREENESGNNSDSTLASNKPELERGTIRASYRNYKQQYAEILKRLSGYRSDKNRADFRPSSKLANPLLAAAGISANGPSRIERIAGRNDGRASVPLPQSQSFNEGLYGNNRGQRVSRLEGGRPNSRHSAYPPSNQSFSTQGDPRMNRYPQQTYPLQHGRYSAMGAPYRDYYASGFDPRRPQSTYMMEQHYSASFGQEPQNGSSLSESEDDDEQGESDDELRQYTSQISSQGQYQAQPKSGDGSELYYFGVVHISLETVQRIMERQPPPPAYYDLKPVEKAAFMFYAAVYKQQYRDVDAFRNHFNREFYKYVCAGDSVDITLYKICKSMQDQYVARVAEKKQRAHEARSLFSDDTSIDGDYDEEDCRSHHETLKSIIRSQSEITSAGENDDASVDENYGPSKFHCPHAFMTFGVGGKTISVQPDQSITVVYMEDIKSYLHDIPTLRVLNTAQTFKGPLIPNFSAPHTVRLYISKQIESIKRSEVAQENPQDNDVVESLLVWQLLETMVKQQGNITGPDIAELLAKVASQPLNIEAPHQNSDISPALNQFTQFLLGGHVDEAIEGAIRNGLFADALVLTRRLYPNNEKRISEIEERFLQTRSLSNPVTTLVSVASGLAPPVLTNPPLDDHLSWRTHAAIILANLDQKETAMNTIYHLGRALAKRDYHCAADFCFLVVCVLAGYDPFQPVLAGEGEEEFRRHISLVNSGLPDDDDSVRCQYGFSITDLHATEIFDYALRLKPDRGVSPLSQSVEYQTYRMKYAKLLASHGLTTDAYKYCVEIARSIWVHYAKFKVNDILEMCDLAESLHYVASAEPSETAWIDELRKMCQTTSGTRQNVSERQNQVHESNGYSQQYQEEGFPPIAENANENVAETHLDNIGTVPTSENDTKPIISNVDLLTQQNYQPAAAPELAPNPANQDVSNNQRGSQEQDIWGQPQQYQDVYSEDLPPTLTAPAVFQSPMEPASYPVPQQPQYQHQLPTLEEKDDKQEHDQKQNTSDEFNSHNAASNSWMGSFKDNVAKPIPAQNQILLPDDNSSSIVWDPTQNKYVDNGIEEQMSAPTPPTMQPAMPTAAPPGGGLRSARGASRYARVGGTNVSSATQHAPPVTASFGFMPASVDDGQSVDPFSGQANPTIHENQNAHADE